ncbi:MAG: hypothetical protein EXS24_00050 [Pedosphaera sp.]|nr:hypothetical protein [Pedosphaera sp.]
MVKHPLFSAATVLLFALAVTCAVLGADEAKPARSQADRESDYYQIVTLPTPAGVQFEAGGLQFVGPDSLACSTRTGDIWIGDGVIANPSAPKWKLFESGLHEVLSLDWRDGWLYAVQRGEITRLKDTNGDGRADVVETVCDGWGISGDYHEYIFGSKFDREGNMWLTLTLTGSFSSQSPYRGWCLRVNKEGKMIPTCSGLRSPGGVGFNAAGDCFFTDNQGPWNGACKLHWLKPGKFVGHPDGNRWFDEPATKDAIAAAGVKKPAQPKDESREYDEAKRIPELLLPAVYFPYPKMGQSASGIACDLSVGKFGPFQEQLFVGDQTHSTVMRVFLEMVGGQYQGVCFPFREGFGSGNLALEFAPDASLFVFGTDRGWGARGGKPFSLQRLSWNGKVPFEIHEMKAKPDGFEFSFTQPVNAESAARSESYAIETYTYIYHASYGSPEVDKTAPKIKEVRVSPDKKSVRLIIDGLVEGHVHEMHLPGVRSATGEALLHDAAYYTLNKIPANN